MKLHKFKVTVTSLNTYEREIIAPDETEAINIFISSINDNDKVCEEQFDVMDIENVGDDDGYTE